MNADRFNKQEIRRQVSAARRGQPDKDRLSRRIIERLTSLSDFQHAGCVLAYIDVRDEVRTRHDLPKLLDGDKTIIVPFCEGENLRLFRLMSLDELTRGAFGILEPKPDLRSLAERSVEVEQIDLAMIPAVAFDRRGARLGHGFGYFDRLLSKMRSDASLIGVAFECQIVEHIPVEPHDIRVHRVVTEKRSFETQPRIGIPPGESKRTS